MITSMAMALGVMLPGCAPQTDIVKTTPSPDGKYIAQIIRKNNAGPGQHSGANTVRLRASNADHFTDIAVFNDDNVHKLIVTVIWEDPSHLEISYKEASIGFQAIRMGAVEISYEEQR